MSYSSPIGHMRDGADPADPAASARPMLHTRHTADDPMATDTPTLPIQFASSSTLTLGADWSHHPDGMKDGP
jgi:hypothetical protein